MKIKINLWNFKLRKKPFSLDQIYLSLLIFITLVISLVNYTPNTILSGWDTLHPEFNFQLALSRALSSGYQEHQGLGAVSAQSHVGDIPRILFLYLSSLIIPMSLIRYFYVFLMLVLGPLGVFLFLKRLLSQVSTQPDTSTPAFLGALFYLCNLSVVQHFSVPLEMFVTLFGVLGFLFHAIQLNLEKISIKNLTYLGVISLFMSPSAHTATLFYMTILVVGVVLTARFFLSKDKKNLAVKAFVILSTIVSVNLFWILPNLYFIFNQGVNVSQSKIHTLFSDLAYLSNLRYGEIQDVSLLKNYLFLWEIYDGVRFRPLLEDWILNLNLVNQLFGYTLFILAILGGAYGAAKKPPIFGGFLAALLLCAIFIASSRSPAGNLMDFIRENIPLMKEALRFPFNKFSTIFSLMIATLLSYFFLEFFHLIKKRGVKVKISIVVIYILGSLYFFLPAFQGKLIQPEMRVKIPDSYFQMFEYLNKQDKYGRVADFPVNSLYGWSYYKFNYQGAGFLWFGIKQPLLNREFDRWGFKNEDYYAEITQAVYNQDPIQLEKILNKYSIRWLLLDENIFSPDESNSTLFLPEIKKLFSEVRQIKLIQNFDSLALYEYFPGQDFKKLTIKDNVKYLSNEHFRENNDYFYLINGNYYSDFANKISFGIKNSKDQVNPQLISSDDTNFYINSIPNIKQPLESFQQVYLDQGYVQIINKNKRFTLSTFLPASQIYSINSNYITNVPRGIELKKNNELKSHTVLGALPVENLKEFLSIGDCSGKNVEANYLFQVSGQNITIKTQNIEVCLVLNLEKMREKFNFGSVLVSSKVAYQNATSSYCFKGVGDCNKAISPAIFQQVSNPSDKELLFFVKPFENSQGQQFLENFSVILLQDTSLSTFEISSDYYQENNNQAVISKSPEYSGNLGKIGSSPKYCKSLVSVRQLLGIYESQDLNICDNFNIGYKPGFYHLLEIKSKNYSGLPLRICLQNEKNQRCSFTVSLPNNKELTSNYFLLPPFPENHNLAITNQVIESMNSKNEISYLAVSPIDYQELFDKNLNLGEGDTSEKSILYLDNSYEKGFVLMCGLLPCNNPHVLVNNWSNGWIVEPGSKLSNYWVLFWPNYLAVLGVLLAVIVIFINFKISKARGRKEE